MQAFSYSNSALRSISEGHGFVPSAWLPGKVGSARVATGPRFPTSNNCKEGPALVDVEGGRLAQASLLHDFKTMAYRL